MTDIELLIVAVAVIIGIVLIGIIYIVWAGIQEHRALPRHRHRPQQTGSGTSIFIALALIAGAMAVLYYLANNGNHLPRFSPFISLPFWSWYVYDRYQQSRQRRAYYNQVPEPEPEPYSPPTTPYPKREQNTPSAWQGVKIGNVQTLIQLTRDRDVAERLIAHNMRQNPGRDRNWACEKAIADLERDRA